MYKNLQFALDTVK